jgi:hypothetical protein
MDALRHRTGVLEIDILRGDLHIMHRGLDVSMPHQLHKRGQADTGTHHIGSKGVSKPVGMGQLDAGGVAMIAEQGA